MHGVEVCYLRLVCALPLGIPHSCICPSVCLSMRPDATITVAACRRVLSAAGDPSRDPAGRPAVRLSVPCSESKSAIYDCCAQCRWASLTRPSRTPTVRLSVCPSVCPMLAVEVCYLRHPSLVHLPVRLSVCPSVRPSVCLSMRPDATITVATCRRVPSAAGDPARDPTGRPAVRLSVACTGSKSAIYDCCAQCRWASLTRPSRTRSCVATRSRATRSSSPTTRRSI